MRVRITPLRAVSTFLSPSAISSSQVTSTFTVVNTRLNSDTERRMEASREKNVCSDSVRLLISASVKLAGSISYNLEQSVFIWNMMCSLMLMKAWKMT